MTLYAVMLWEWCACLCCSQQSEASWHWAAHCNNNAQVTWTERIQGTHVNILTVILIHHCALVSLDTVH